MAMGNADDMRRMADQLELETQAIAGIYARRTGQPVEEMVNLLREETWFDTKQAAEMKFIDGVYELPSAQARAETKKVATTLSPIEVLRLRAGLAGRPAGQDR
jgi:ATP-dependent protease ClpP protease subunit